MSKGQQRKGHPRRSPPPTPYHKQTAISDSLRQTLLPQANQLPLVGCWMTANWSHSEQGLVQAIIAREQPDGRVAYASFLVDVYCLGVKDAHHDMNLTAERFEIVWNHLASLQPLVEAPIEAAHQLIYQAIDYAARWGFKPHPDFAKASYFLAPRGTYPEDYQLTFGKDGKPFFVQGPHDNVRAVVAQLERTAGQGNYNYMVHAE
mgnify:CR=1 FL=1